MATRHLPIDLLIGTGDYGIANAQRTRDDLRARGFEVRYTELPGVGHCCPLNGRAFDIGPGSRPVLFLDQSFWHPTGRRGLISPGLDSLVRSRSPSTTAG